MDQIIETNHGTMRCSEFGAIARLRAATYNGGMLQTFDSVANPSVGAHRVKALRALMTRAGIDAWLVPRSDEHQGEYVPPSAERLAWLTGFSGSAGLAVIALKAAAV